MEQKLYQAAAALPGTELTFESVRSKCVHVKRKRLPRILKIAIAAVLVLSMCVSGLAYAKTNYSMWVGPDIVTLGGIARSTGYTLPQTLGGVSFRSARKLYLVHEGTSQLDALLHPLYTVCEITYGTNEKEENGGHYLKTFYTVYICKMDDPLWRHFSGFGEDNIWSPASLNTDSYYTTEYRGHTLQLGTTGTTETCHVHWVDTAHNVCIGISSTSVGSLHELEAVAAGIIDLNN